ncbi:hypothetical protein [Chamaesiphon polymorphus]|jgi:hypothetical protein|uniref:Uncharacterized protein n=1 Tax=Chamaesiphon polymorphus CCALA 037 TaxID=2107692 RepID=A0A2T1F6Y3_9CYAN|nr:hypothetical protein [Chamaesiphon polymorphus]PSB40668.1 hypothetical protein C7B77_28105 [Chamaesiphon polymorphus CCALA 037]
MTASRDTSPASEIELLEERPVTRDLDALDRLETFLYLIPVMGVLPSMWAIYRRQRDKRQLAVCRLSILLAFIWLTTYMSLNVGADISGSSAIGFRLLFLNGLATSTYFMTSLWLMMLLWQKKSLRLPGFSNLAERTIRQN